MSGHNAKAPAPTVPASLREVLNQLVQTGQLAPSRLAQATSVARRQQLPLDTVLQEMGLLSAPRLAQLVAQASACQRYRPLVDTPDRAVARRYPRAQAVQQGAMPVADAHGVLTVVLVDVFDPLIQDRLLSAFPGRQLDKRVATRAELHDLVQAVWSEAPEFEKLEAMLDGHVLALPNLTPGLAQAQQPAVVQLCERLLEHAVAQNASDLHLDPGEHLFNVRMRVDGGLRDVCSMRMAHWPALLNRLKILADIDIGKHLSAQGGQFSLRTQGRLVNFRVALLPTLHGESLVMRVLDQRRGGFELEDLAISIGARHQLQKALQRPDGLLLVTGPVASGKTTTAATLLGALGVGGRCVITLEDPVEITLSSARQVPVRAEQGLGFGPLMREVLRQDADVVFLGEIREADAAALTVSTAMIGKRVLATLHARHGGHGVARVLSLGVDPGALADTLVAVSNQRLLPRLCPSCRQPQSQGHRGWVAAGCLACLETGIQGRLPVMEVLIVDEPMRDAIARSDLRTLRQQAAATLMQADLRSEALDLVATGEVAWDTVLAQVHLGEG
jgi:type II secretory ATPase GspE/PulE/Tfp pilus assembly ATPase PilB-like protein